MKTPEKIAAYVIRGVKSYATLTDCNLVRAGMAEAYRSALKRIDEGGTFHITDWLKHRAEECEK